MGNTFDLNRRRAVLPRLEETILIQIAEPEGVPPFRRILQSSAHLLDSRRNARPNPVGIHLQDGVHPPEGPQAPFPHHLREALRGVAWTNETAAGLPNLPANALVLDNLGKNGAWRLIDVSDVLTPTMER